MLATEKHPIIDGMNNFGNAEYTSTTYPLGIEIINWMVVTVKKINAIARIILNILDNNKSLFRVPTLIFNLILIISTALLST